MQPEMANTIINGKAAETRLRINRFLERRENTLLRTPSDSEISSYCFRNGSRNLSRVQLWDRSYRKETCTKEQVEGMVWEIKEMPAVG